MARNSLVYRNLLQSILGGLHTSIVQVRAVNVQSCNLVGAFYALGEFAEIVCVNDPGSCMSYNCRADWVEEPLRHQLVYVSVIVSVIASCCNRLHGETDVINTSTPRLTPAESDDMSVASHHWLFTSTVVSPMITIRFVCMTATSV